MEHRDRLDAYLATRDLEELWFAHPASFAWLTGGDNVVDAHAPVGVAAAGYDGDHVEVVTNTIEAERLATEELPSETLVTAYDWHEWSLAEMVQAQSNAPAAADFDVPGFDSLDASALRQPLTEADVARYRSLGRDTAAAVESVCRDTDSEMTEQAVVADLRHTLAQRGIDAPVALVGSGSRAPRYRHYTPTETALGSYALVSVTATRDGLYASTTRTVAFDPPEWLQRRHEQAARVQTTALAATRETGRDGGTAGAVFSDIQAAYARLGHDGEWEHHHQGGAAGYAGREWIATPDFDEPVSLPMAYAWNPTIQGAKSEDTWLVTEDGFECLTRTGEWETTRRDAVGYDCRLDHPDILTRA
ncbi:MULTISPECIES: Xaa-Pro peptidase family protein [unclassified Haladaptatus]|uniref:M24 family metallopeptidase n=1 Tax=unclassified Haladaptatus TaxID=2622732 RepID=UPI0023E778ED|nr:MULTISPECIES: M24 family metallopeptidase [unclassified Haladaptatus]